MTTFLVALGLVAAIVALACAWVAYWSWRQVCALEAERARPIPDITNQADPYLDLQPRDPRPVELAEEVDRRLLERAMRTVR